MAGPQTHEWLFYELMWRVWSRGAPYPLPWWIQQYFRRWSDDYDRGLFDSKEAAFCSNASYRYWNMIGVKDHHQESLIGQAGEIEPVYDKYALSFFLFNKQNNQLWFPQYTSAGLTQPSLEQNLVDGYLPSVKTLYRTPLGVEVEALALATVTGSDNKSVVVNLYTVRYTSSTPVDVLFCLSLLPAGPTGFQRHDKAGRYLSDRRIGQLSLDPNNKFAAINSTPGPVFNRATDYFGLYGNGSSYDPDHYIHFNPFQELAQNGQLNQYRSATDYIGGLCSGVFAWETHFSASTREFKLEVKLPVDDYRGATELNALNNTDGEVLNNQNNNFWRNKLDASGLQVEMPPVVNHLKDLYRTCRANLLILADQGQIHPGPTIYDDFWIRDSSIEGIAAAMAGDQNLAARQFGTHYPNKFNLNAEWIGPVSTYGFFGGDHEKNDREWDSNGQALWAIGHFDRINGSSNGFGSGLYSPYVLLGARWLRDNRSTFGLLHSGWSAEHIGDKHQPHYWDDFWGIAGLYEAAKLAERIGAHEVGELWDSYHSLRSATIDSIRWVLSEQARRGHWETFIPTGPGDVGRLDSTMIGALAYFHPCRLYMNNKLSTDIDYAARMTLETIWEHFIDNGGFRHDSAWNCYGPYLTLQLAHAFLLIGDRHRMDTCMNWSVSNAAYSTVSRDSSNESWQVVLGAWNEQHCYPVAKDFAEFPQSPWYMGDIPHGWACAEYLSLIRDILFFEADEDGDSHIYIAPGLMPHWLQENQRFGVSGAPTLFGEHFSYSLHHLLSRQQVEITISQHPTLSYYVFSCPFGNHIVSALFDGNPAPISGNDNTLHIPSGTNQIEINYQ